VISDLGASGAYYIASAADQIYADKASLVGSIGVTAAGYGFVGTMEKLGVERRTYTSGEHKSFLDPFQPQKPDETAFWQGVLDTTHKQFINSVKQGRGDRLKDKEHPELFSGLVWSGEQALPLGLIDGLGNASSVARDVIGEKELVDFTVQESPFDRFSKKLGASVAEQLAMWMGSMGLRCADPKPSLVGWGGRICTPSASSMSTRRISGRPIRLVASAFGALEQAHAQAFGLEAAGAVVGLFGAGSARCAASSWRMYGKRHAVDLAVPGLAVEQCQAGEEGHAGCRWRPAVARGLVEGVACR
jgi:hypothetical protein